MTETATATATAVAETGILIANVAAMATAIAAIKTGLQSATETDQGSVIVIEIVTVTVIASVLAAIDPRLLPPATTPKPVV